MENAEKEPTVREALSDAIALHTETPDPNVVESQPAQAEPDRPGRTAGRPRDERGKLLPGKPVKAATAEPQNAAPEQPQPAETIPAQEAQPTAPAAAPVRPKGWTKEMWPIYDKLNSGQSLTAEEAQKVAKYSIERETHAANGVSTYREIARSAEPLLQAIAPFQADLDQHGIKAPDMVHRLMSAHKSLSLGSPMEKLQLLNKLAQDYRIPIQALYDQNAQQQFLSTPHVAQPQPTQQQAPISEVVRKEIEAMKVQEEISNMARNTEQYPFFSYVRGTMQQLLAADEATDLNDAYEKALDAPEHAMLTTVMHSQQTQAAEQQRLASAQATARVARANTVSTRSASPATSGAAPKGNPSVREALTAAIEQHRTSARV